MVNFEQNSYKMKKTIQILLVSFFSFVFAGFQNEETEIGRATSKEKE